ncbi:uncharacterized protein LOC117226346 [Megalopta genalis]|uniref:uncharacterized protein LOC117226346 n=1 Tax=Megalopta genalis TaxID=115081 RepID=UPI003FD204ED
MSQPRRPKVSIYDYPEHLNPFNDELNNIQPHTYQDAKSKDSKHKFWTFGRSRKKRSNSFSIKSTWSGLFGKRKDEKEEQQQKRSTITTVSSTYKRESNPVAPIRPTKDQEEFNEALGTLARRRKYTLDNSSRYSSSLTVNGDPARMYDGSPQDTTTSIMGDLTPKPPARRFGQVSPKPTDKIPPLDYEIKDMVENGSVTLREKPQETTPIPPLRRFGNRASQRANQSAMDSEDEGRPGDPAFCDENENVPDDYVFKRFTQDAVRKSNLSINSCTSIGSTMSSYGRKKRRAPQPPRPSAKVETTEKIAEAPNIELQIVEPSDIARVTENIDEMTKKSKDLDVEVDEKDEKSTESVTDASSSTEASVTKDSTVASTEINADEKLPEETECIGEKQKQTELRSSPTNDKEKSENKDSTVPEETATKVEEDVPVEYRRNSRENVEIMKEVDELSPSEVEEVCLKKNSSSDSLSRSDSFSVKDEIEKIEKQIKELEARSSMKESEEDHVGNTRQLLQENRRHFFQNFVNTEKEAIKIEFKEFPREQKDIHVVRLNDSPIPVPAPREPVKVIELHISEPIRQMAEIVEDVNPIPKPRRHSAQSLNDTRSSPIILTEERINRNENRGKSF